MTCTGLLHEARVTVEVALLERAAFPTPILAGALVLSLVGLALAGNEAGLLMTRWVVAGEPRTLLKAKPGRGP